MSFPKRLKPIVWSTKLGWLSPKFYSKCSVSWSKGPLIGMQDALCYKKNSQKSWLVSSFKVFYVFYSDPLMYCYYNRAPNLICFFNPVYCAFTFMKNLAASRLEWPFQGNESLWIFVLMLTYCKPFIKCTTFAGFILFLTKI